jgi:hypothetical protein
MIDMILSEIARAATRAAAPNDVRTERGDRTLRARHASRKQLAISYQG